MVHEVFSRMCDAGLFESVLDFHTRTREFEIDYRRDNGFLTASTTGKFVPGLWEAAFFIRMIDPMWIHMEKEGAMILKIARWVTSARPLVNFRS
jgi:hypothetical protein